MHARFDLFFFDSRFELESENFHAQKSIRICTASRGRAFHHMLDATRIKSSLFTNTPRRVVAMGDAPAPRHLQSTNCQLAIHMHSLKLTRSLCAPLASNGAHKEFVKQ